MLKFADTSRGRWILALAAHLRPGAQAAGAVDESPLVEAEACRHCGHALPAGDAGSPRCVLCGDGDSSLALYSRHALHRTAFTATH